MSSETKKPAKKRAKRKTQVKAKSKATPKAKATKKAKTVSISRKKSISPAKPIAVETIKPADGSLRHDLICAMAYELWSRRGGDSVENWLDAERLVDDSA